MNRQSLIAAYLRQQQELGMPDPVFPDSGRIKSIISSSQAPHHSGNNALKPGGPAAIKQAQRKTPFTRLSRLPIPASTVKEPMASYGAAASLLPTRSLPYEKKRAVFKEMYAARCGKCDLSKSRRTFVFGAGNVDAPLMVIGEAPGAEEDEQGLPFVGAAGRLLNEMLEAVALDRKKDVFITNILKCRPPDNRTPDAAEVSACLPMVQKQIEVVAPRLILLLGRVAAHALLGTADGIGKLRGREHEYRGIPVIVTYHPAALLRSADYRGPAEEDFRTMARLLKGKR
jgi:uracil-DNA glycosylase